MICRTRASVVCAPPGMTSVPIFADLLRGVMRAPEADEVPLATTYTSAALVVSGRGIGSLKRWHYMARGADRQKALTLPQKQVTALSQPPGRPPEGARAHPAAES